MGKVHTHGKMAHSILVSGMKIEFMGKVNTHGMMVASMKVTGKIIIWMAMVYTHGRMAENMKVIIKKIKSMGKVYTLGQMEENTMDNGKMEDKMAAVNIYQNKVNTAKAFGKMEREKNGWTKTRNTDIYSA